jgi:hypothetical protein
MRGGVDVDAGVALSSSRELARALGSKSPFSALLSASFATTRFTAPVIYFVVSASRPTPSSFREKVIYRRGW